MLDVADTKNVNTEDGQQEIVRAFHDERIKDCSNLLKTRMEFLKEVVLPNETWLSAHDKYHDALLLAGADPNIQGIFSQTALHLACSHGYGKVVRILLKSEYNIDVNIKEAFGWTPMMVAVNSGHEGVFFLLVKIHKPNENDLDKYKMNLLHLACKGGNLAIVKNLIDKHRFHVNSWSEQGTPLMLAMGHNNIDLCQFLVDSGAVAFEENMDGDSILHIACRCGSHALIERLLTFTGLAIDVQGQHGWTPLMVAAANGKYEVFRVLKDLGAKVENQVDPSKNSLLHLACQGGNESIVRYLLPLYGVHIKGEEARTPLETAELYKQSSIVELLKMQATSGCEDRHSTPEILPGHRKHKLS
ncbi:ankyrin-1-like [Haliotis rubra]|uniref:ankyrin-1-like n=1 Tax=Haliotis rubra TaxID=36100 RepID=UPI001EE5CC49|nr:ankyrin-1-like [Haliotis rubra]